MLLFHSLKLKEKTRRRPDSVPGHTRRRHTENVFMCFIGICDVRVGRYDDTAGRYESVRDLALYCLYPLISPGILNLMRTDLWINYIFIDLYEHQHDEILLICHILNLLDEPKCLSDYFIH